MKHARTKSALIIASFVMAPGWSSRADDLSNSKDLLRDAYTKEAMEQKRKEELEEEAATKKDRLEKEKHRVESEIESHRYQTESLKLQQDRLREEIEAATSDLAHVTDQLAAYQDEHKKFDETSKSTQDYLIQVQDNLKITLKQLNEEIVALSDDRRKSEQEIYSKSMDIQRWKSEIATLESKVGEAEAKRAELESQEMKVRTEWTQAKIAAANNMKQREEALVELSEAKKRHEVAVRDLNQARLELAKAEKIKSETTKKAAGEVAEYERQINDATHKRMAAESEQIRLESETTKTLDYVARVKENKNKAVDQSTEAHGIVMKSTLALESARTELNQTVSKEDRKTYQREKEDSISRGIAAAQQASDMLGGGRVWVTKSKCSAYSKPSEGKAVGFFESGNRLLGKDSGSAWVEITNGVGSAVFVPSKCGKYED